MCSMVLLAALLVFTFNDGRTKQPALLPLPFLLEWSNSWGLTQALSITGLLTWAVRVLTDLETQFMSVMRTMEVTDLLESTNVKGLDAEEVTSRMPREYSGAGEALRAF